MKDQTTLPRARDLMSRQLHTVAPDLPLAEVVQFLLKHQVSNAPVVEELSSGKARLVGFISEGDCLEALSTEMFFGNPVQPRTARHIMKRHPVCVEPDTEVFTLASIFISHRYRHLPVVEDGCLIGMVSRRDILKALEQYYREGLHQRDLDRFPPDIHEIINHRFIIQD